MNSRERVLCALNHEAPDRTPLFVGTSGVTSVLGPGYPRLRQHLGLPEVVTRWLSKPLQYVWMDEDILQQLGSDGRAVMPGPTASPWRREVSPDGLIDDWGCPWQRAPGSEYFEVREAPLSKATIQDLEKYPWPNLMPPERFAGLADRCRAIQEAGYACVLMTGVTLFEQACLMRGLSECLMDLASDPEFYLALQDRIKSLALPYLKELCRQVGPYVDVLVTGDDLGAQDSTLMAPATYRRFIKPHEAEVLATIKQATRAKIFFHSCGNIRALIGDLVEIGVDLLNPIQVSAGTMADTAALKKEFGDRLSFCGGIDTRWVLPHGTTEDVRNEVRRRISDLGTGGGYVAASVHCLQPDVPPANIVAMCDEVVRGKRTSSSPA